MLVKSLYKVVRYIMRTTPDELYGKTPAEFPDYDVCEWYLPKGTKHPYYVGYIIYEGKLKKVVFRCGHIVKDTEYGRR